MIVKHNAYPYNKHMGNSDVSPAEMASAEAVFPICRCGGKMQAELSGDCADPCLTVNSFHRGVVPIWTHHWLLRCVSCSTLCNFVVEWDEDEIEGAA